MGILAGPAQWLRDLVEYLPKNFHVCELGDQYLTQTGGPRQLAKEFYEELGCGRYESIDGNGRGTITWDLNKPFPAKSHPGTFHLVTDFGTGEHIFNQYAVWLTLNSLAKKSGYIVFDRPMQGYPEHCYYNTHECLFRDIAEANHYRIVKLERRDGDDATRGELIRGIFQRRRPIKFQVPQQGRYRKLLRPITGDMRVAK